MLMVCVHVDDNKISHKLTKVVDATIEWLKQEYEVNRLGAIKVCCRKVHTYLGMTLDFTTKGEVHAEASG